MRKLSPLGQEFFAKGRVDDCPIYDMHGHAGPYSRIRMATDDGPKMIASMDRAGVRLLAFCHHYSLFCTESGNAANIELARYAPDRFRAYCAINPNYPADTERDVATFDQYRDVHIGFKLLADYHLQPITCEAYAPAWEKADRNGLLMLLHTWAGSPCDGPLLVRACAEQHSNAKILLGHCCHSDWDAAIALARDFPNVYLEICAVVDERGVLERFVKEVGSEKVVYGTDFPWFDEHYYIGAVLGADIDDEDRRNIFYRNAQRLLGQASSGRKASPEV